MAFSTWWAFNDGMVNSDRDEGGVYEIADSRGTVIYIGSSGQIKTRLKQHLNEAANACIKRNGAQYHIEYRSDYAAEELRLYNAFVRANGRQPLCNSVSPPG